MDSKRMDDPNDGDIREGFLCPDCQAQFPTHMQLESHYEVAHLLASRDVRNETNNRSVNPLKDILGKAKKILINDQDRPELESTSGGNDADAGHDESCDNQKQKVNESEFYLMLRQGQTIGFEKDLFDDHFKKIRDSRIERQVLETNKLLIILDRLLRGMPQDPEKRKIHEMNIVKWANDDDVSLCPFCAKSFNIGRRRHHCRLCGAIMCHDCSQFLELNYARKLVAPVNIENPDQPTSYVPPSGIVVNDHNHSPSGKLMAKLSEKTSSLLNLNIGKESNVNEILIRVCSDCKRLLDKRNRQLENRHAKPPIRTMYEKLKELQTEADKLVPTYLRMCNSLRSGETTYQLADARTVRIQLMKLTDALAIVSRKIFELDVQEDQPLPPTFAIQKKLRLFASQYIRKVMCGLPNLPREEELEKLQEQRHRQLQMDIELEKMQLALGDQNSRAASCSRAKTQHSLITKEFEPTNNDLVNYDDGWGIQNVTIDHEDLKDLDPIQVQINILKDYIKQARKEHRYDEVNMLENNLKQLEIEHYFQDNSILAEPQSSQDNQTENAATPKCDN